MKKQVLLLVSVLSNYFLIAQLNFYQGYIISNEGDTLKGEIKVNPKKELPLFAKVMFRDQQGVSKTYKPDKVKGFAYYNTEKKRWHQFISIIDDEPKFYKICIQHPVVIYEYQFEDMQMGEFFTSKQYFIKEKNEFVRLKSKKIKKQLANYIDKEEVLNELEKMDDIDIDKLYSLIEKHYTQSPS